MEGKETELDKTIIEAIKDPLTHLVRNAVDHGIEPPEVRRVAGKNPEGLLFLRAFHEGGQVNIEVTDDGAGLDHDRIRNKAIQKALISADQAARMTEREITNLIFLPGFSTAEKVSNVSGRGVGMDVVKTNIEKIGGMVDVQSKTGQGSTVRMKIPLTLAIIPALIVTTAGDRYAIPQVSLLELVRLEGDQARKGLEMVNGAPVYRLRGRLLPLVCLGHELKTGIRSQQAAANQLMSAQNTELPDFADARQKHRQWIGRIKDVLETKTRMTVEQAGSPKDCALGKWLYSAGLKEYGDIAEMQELEKKHRRFHELVRDVIGLHAKGDKAAAERGFSSLEPMSADIISLLNLVEQKVLEAQNVNIVVLRADDRIFGLIVDQINDTEEIVVKPLGKQLKSINTYAGATIMGDGKVALILDVLGLAQRANVINEVRDRSVVDTEEKDVRRSSAAGQRKTLLLFQHGGSGRIAIELSLVARLEEFPRDAVEIAADQEVVQYRGQIMPLIHISEVLESTREKKSAAEGEALHVVVYTHNGRSVGLVVDCILDIVDEAFVMQPQSGRKGIMGSAVIQKRVTDILDLPALIAATRRQRLIRCGTCVKRGIMATTQQFCTFFLQDQLFGVPVQQVQEVIRYLEMTRVPLVPPVIRGLINLRGQIVMAIDLRRRFGMVDRLDSELPMNIVVRTEDGAVSFLVDDIGDVIEVSKDTLEAPPATLRGPVRTMLLGVYKLANQLLLELDINTVIAFTDLPKEPRAEV